MHVLDEPNEIREATEDLRLIRQTMERSTKHSSLSGVAGLLIGVWAIGGVLVTDNVARTVGATGHSRWAPLDVFAIWSTVLVISALTDFLLNKRRAAKVGKYVFSPLGARMLQGAGPSFFAGLVLTLFLVDATNSLDRVWGVWMMLYGLAISAVGLFSVRPVSVLGTAFLLAGALTLALPAQDGLAMMALAFGGFHIAYGLWTGIVRGDW